MLCPICQNPLPDDAVYCSRCGSAQRALFAHSPNVSQGRLSRPWPYALLSALLLAAVFFITGINPLNIDSAAGAYKPETRLPAAWQHFAQLGSGKAIVFDDANLETAIRLRLNKPEGDITEADAQSMTRLVLTSWSIESVEALKYFTNLTHLDLRDNRISDITPLSGLCQTYNALFDAQPHRGLFARIPNIPKA